MQKIINNFFRGNSTGRMLKFKKGAARQIIACLRRSVILLSCSCIYLMSFYKGQSQNIQKVYEAYPADEYTQLISTKLVTPNSTIEAQRLYEFLRSLYGKKIISSVMNLSSFDEINWLKKHTGKEPAMIGL